MKAIRERVITRNMPPWHLDKTVGIQHFANDRSLSDEQIATIVRWADLARRWEIQRICRLPSNGRPMTAGSSRSSLARPTSLSNRSRTRCLRMGQDVWFKPLTDIGITEERWVRAVEMRPSTPAGRRIVHHALAGLRQDEALGERRCCTRVPAC